LVVAGALGWGYRREVALIDALGLRDSVIMTGYVPTGDLPAVYAMAEALVFPSIVEGFGLPPLEAMACGTPVVCSNAASLPEVVGDAALLVDPTDVDGLATAMERVLTDADLAADLRERGLARAAGFTWARTARETVGVYERVLRS
jgi:glycosyltransferase involved in cell wall biosynthesis